MLFINKILTTIITIITLGLIGLSPIIVANDNRSTSESLHSEKELPRCVIVIFGATGDLTARKLLPAIYNLKLEGHISKEVAIVGVGRSKSSHEEFRAIMKKSISEHSRNKPNDLDFWQQFENNIYYLQADLEEDMGYKSLHEFLDNLDQKHETDGKRLYYLATPPHCFSTIIEKLSTNDLIYKSQESSKKWSRVIIEKPFGIDLTTAIEMQNHVEKHLNENQVYRIDHYLGKEGVQNLLKMRFENTIFEPIWNNQYIDNIQITISEAIGIGTRGRFWESTGYLRDIVQNHLMQLLAIVAMEPPKDFSASSIHFAKAEAMKAIRPIPVEELDRFVVRGQYSTGEINGSKVPAYKQELGVSKNSTIETYMAAKLFIDNPRWQGVPFYIRGGKRMPYQTTEIVITLKQENHSFITPSKAIFIRIQPNPAIFLRTLSKVSGAGNSSETVLLGITPESYFKQSIPDAYEKLIFDCIQGNSSLFVNPEEQISSWELLNPVLNAWKTSSTESIPLYPSGTWGPAEADQLMEQSHQWHLSDIKK